MIGYAKKVAFGGSPEKALEVARSAFLPLGFRIVAVSSAELRVTGPGMRRTAESPLKGISEATIRVSRSGIEIDAVLGGAAWMGRFVLLFPPALGAVLAIVLWIMSFFSPDLQNPIVVWAPVLAVSPWVVLGPLVARGIRRSAEKAIDALLENMVELGRS